MSYEISIERLKKELIEEEGLKYSKYRCSTGHLTIGIGHNLDVDPVDKIIGRKLGNSKISEKEVNLIFLHDVRNVVEGLDRNYPWWDDLPVFAQYVLISLCFNMGIGTLVHFTNTMASFRRRDWIGVSNGLRNSKWYRQVGKRGPKLIKIIETNKFPDGDDE